MNFNAGAVRSRIKVSAVFLPALVLAVGFIVTAAAVLRAQSWVEEDLARKLAHETEEIAQRMQQQFALQEETLRGLTSLYVASDEVTHADFHAYIDQLGLVERFPALVDLRYARHLRQDELAAWQRQAATHLAAHGVTRVPTPRPAGAREAYLLVEYVEPFAAAAIGLDLLQSPGRRPAIARLQAGADFALSARLRGEYPEAPHYALLARLPARGDDPFPGIVTLIFRPDRLVQDIAATAQGLDLKLYDRPAGALSGGAIEPVFDTSPARAAAPQALQARLPLKVGDAEWTLAVTVLPDWAPLAQNRWFPIAAGAFGGVLTLLLTLGTYLLVRRWQQAEQSLSVTWQDLLRAQSVAGVGSWHLYAKTGELRWTPQVYEIFGLPQGAPVDYERFLACVHPDDRARVEAAWQRALAGEPYRIEHRIVAGDETRWIEERAELVFDERGKFIEAHGTARDITRELEAEQALRQLNAELEARVTERTAQLNAVVNNLVDGLVVIDPQGIVQIANPALEGLLGYPPEEVVGHNVSLLMPEPHRSAHDGYIARYLATGDARIIGIGREVEALHKNGERIPVDLSVSTFTHGGQRYFVGLLHDLRSQKAMLDRLEQLLRERQEFLATMSHEIRTPLTGLLGMLELLSLTPLPPEERHQLAIARDSGKALTRIIDDILDYSKIEAGKLALSPHPEDLRALIEGVRDAHLATASAKGLSLLSFVDPRLPQALVMDGLRVRQILQNFVSNALKFTAEGYVELRAEWLGEENGKVTLKLLVRDTGIGISPEAQRHLFERYAQADATTARRYGGTGLGLAICKHLAELMHGTIGVESQPTKGSSFFVTLTLPVAESAPPATPAAAGVALRQLDSGGRPVLVADDHPTNRALIARQLALLGLPVELAENGNQALAKWKHGNHALIVTDVHMPVMDGFELAQAVRAIEAQEGRKPTPIIAWTAAAMGEEVARCRAAGMDDVLVKPTELASLRATLARWLPFAAANGTAPLDGNVVLDRGVLGQLADGGEEERLILADFLSQTRRDLAELEAALARDDAAAAAREAHRIKGAARMIGALRLAGRAARAEDAARRHDLAGASERLREMQADLAELEASAGLSQVPAPVEEDAAPPVWDAAVLADMVGDSPKLQQELIDSFFAHADAPLQEMRGAYEKREARPLARAAHKLKSAARAIGALELASLCAAIEAAGNNADWEMAAAGYQKIDDAWTRLAARLQGERA
ncbi:MAG: PAS domain S-box protein [Pseudomonadota bacterium]